MAEEGNKRAALVNKLSDNYDKLLSTILVGNNIVNIATTSLMTVLFVGLYGVNMGATIATVVSTVAVLIFGEISPKSLAKEAPEKFAMFSAPLLRVLLVLLTPVNFIFSLWKKLLSKIFKTSEDRSITESELLTIVEEAEQGGTIDEDDRELIINVFDFNDEEAGEILTPRVDIIGVTADMSKDEIADVFAQTGYSRIPVYDGSIDRIEGVIHLKDFFIHARDNGVPIKSIMKPVVFAAPSMKISELLKLLQKNKIHLAVITDEYGGTAGIVTMEDILEELVGDIWDEHDEIVEEFVQLDENTYRVLCSAALDDMFDLFEIKDEAESNSVGGWVMTQLNKIPEEGDTFEFANLAVEVTKADHNRAVEVLVRILPPDEEAEQEE